VEILNLDSGKMIQEFPLKQPDYPWVEWHPEGNILGAAGADQNIYFWDVATGESIGKPLGTGGGARFVFSHSGDLVASTAWDEVCRLWDWRTGQQLFNVHSCEANPLRFSPDDRLLAAVVAETTVGLWEINPGAEYRRLARDQSGDPCGLSVRADGRFLAVALKGGFGLWDLESCRPAGYGRVDGNVSTARFEASGSVLTYGEDGLLRWPVESDPAAPGLLRVGPAELLFKPGAFFGMAASSDSKVVAIGRGLEGALVLHQDHPDDSMRLGPHWDVRYIAVSPDGRWIATGGFNEPGGAKLWDAQSCKLIKDLPVGRWCGVAFSPDGNWLATTGGGRLRVWSVGSWSEGPAIPGTVEARMALAFSPDSKALAVETGAGVIRLVDVNTGRDFAQLEEPNQEDASYLAFSPSGNRLATTSRTFNSIHIWDLAAIHRRLAEMGLDWE
jgi:WD40 repeat protein